MNSSDTWVNFKVQKLYIIVSAQLQQPQEIIYVYVSLSSLFQLLLLSTIWIYCKATVANFAVAEQWEGYIPKPLL